MANRDMKIESVEEFIKACEKDKVLLERKVQRNEALLEIAKNPSLYQAQTKLLEAQYGLALRTKKGVTEELEAQKTEWSAFEDRMGEKASLLGPMEIEEKLTVAKKYLGDYQWYIEGGYLVEEYHRDLINRKDRVDDRMIAAEGDLLGHLSVTSEKADERMAEIREEALSIDEKTLETRVNEGELLVKDAQALPDKYSGLTTSLQEKIQVQKESLEQLTRLAEKVQTQQIPLEKALKAREAIQEKVNESKVKASDLTLNNQTLEKGPETKEGPESPRL